MRRFSYEFSAQLDFSNTIRDQYAVLRCLPYPDETQTFLTGSISVEPWHPMSYSTDGFGNRIMSGSFRSPHNCFSYHETGKVVIDLSAAQEVTPHPMYRFPGHLTRPDKALTEFAAGLSSNDPEYLSRAISEHFTYTPGSTHVGTSAAESFAGKKGVCQDYAQVLAAVCRLKGLSARYCMGITEGYGVTHAWTQILWKNKWLGIDPTRECLVNEGYLCFAVGRDAMDCHVERGTFYGSTQQIQTVQAQMTEE